MICLSVTCDCVLVGDLTVIVSPLGCAASGGKRKFGVFPLVFIRSNTSNDGFCVGRRYVANHGNGRRSGRYANAYHLRTSPERRARRRNAGFAASRIAGRAQGLCFSATRLLRRKLRVRPPWPASARSRRRRTRCGETTDGTSPRRGAGHRGRDPWIPPARAKLVPSETFAAISSICAEYCLRSYVIVPQREKGFRGLRYAFATLRFVKCRAGFDLTAQDDRRRSVSRGPPRLICPAARTGDRPRRRAARRAGRPAPRRPMPAAALRAPACSRRFRRRIPCHVRRGY